MFVECRTMTRRASQLITGNETGSVGGVGCLFSINHRIPLMTTFPRADQTCWLLLAFFHLSRTAHLQGYRICFRRWKNEIFVFLFRLKKIGHERKEKKFIEKMSRQRQTIYGTERILRWGMLFVIYRLCNAKCLLKGEQTQNVFVCHLGRDVMEHFSTTC